LFLTADVIQNCFPVKVNMHCKTFRKIILTSLLCLKYLLVDQIENQLAFHKNEGSNVRMP